MRRGLQLEVWTALTDRHPIAEAAYFARDEEMIRSADRVLAFWDGNSTGTWHELAYAKKLAKPIDLVVVKREPSPHGFTGGDAA
jgi:nucleoside 2-deoxyribosyltransferase